MIPWDRFDRAFGGVFRPVGRAAKPTRLMGAAYLEQIQGLSDGEIVERWAENPYRQHFRGFEFFQHEPPIDPSMMTRWRKRIGGPGTMEEVLGATIEAAGHGHPTSSAARSVSP